MISVVHAGRALAAAAAAASCTVAAAALLAASLALFVLPYHALSYVIERLRTLGQRLRRS